MPRRSAPARDPFAPLKNIGPTTRAWLVDVGVPDATTLQRLGAVEVYRRLKAQLPSRVSLNALYALHAALDGVHWNTYPDDVKAQMRAEVEAVGTLPTPRRSAR